MNAVALNGVFLGRIPTDAVELPSPTYPSSFSFSDSVSLTKCAPVIGWCPVVADKRVRGFSVGDAHNSHSILISKPISVLSTGPGCVALRPSRQVPRFAGSD